MENVRLVNQLRRVHLLGSAGEINARWSALRIVVCGFRCPFGAVETVSNQPARAGAVCATALPMSQILQNAPD